MLYYGNYCLSVSVRVKSFGSLERTLGSQPPRLGAVLRRIDQGQGREALSRDQQPQVLRRLEQSTRVASITASNAIENINVDPERAERIASDAGGLRFRGRNEEEFAGYRDAIDEIARGGGSEELSIPMVLHVHRTLYTYSGGGGGRLKSDPNQIVEYVDGLKRVIFVPPPPQDVEWMLSELLARYHAAVRSERAHPLLLIAVFVLDFLAIHPVADGNGRLSRLITQHLLLGAGYEVTRYVSIEQRIHASKYEYYAALRASQVAWHDERHDVWPFVEYLCGIMSGAYDDFEGRMAAVTTPAGNKQDQVREYVLHHAPDRFKMRDVDRALPGISAPTIRLVMKSLRDEGHVAVDGRGPGATWSRATGGHEPEKQQDQARLL